MLNKFVLSKTFQLKRLKYQRNFRCSQFRSKHIILGIETSCDDTCAAVITEDKILSNVILTQNHLHESWGGIVPSIAAQGHTSQIDNVVNTALEKSGKSMNDITAIAVTRGPGLSLCLKVGLSKGINLSLKHNIPLIPVNHMEGHTLIPRFMNKDITFPFLTLLISGGHTQILVCRGVGDYVLLGETLDIALGDVYDKVSRILKLSSGVGGGKEIENVAKNGDHLAFPFTLPMKRNKNCDFSFSGIQTAVSLTIKKFDEESFFSDNQNIANLAASFQNICVEHLLDRVKRAIHWCENTGQVSQLIISGGVASNKYIVSRLSALTNEYNIETILPPRDLICDNAVMIAWAGLENLQLGLNVLEIPPQELRYIPRWPLDNNRIDYFPGTHSVMHNTDLLSFDIEHQIHDFLEKITDNIELPNKKFVKFAKKCISIKKFSIAVSICKEGLIRFPDDFKLKILLEKALSYEINHKNRYG